MVFVNFFRKTKEVFWSLMVGNPRVYCLIMPIVSLPDYLSYSEHHGIYFKSRETWGFFIAAMAVRL